TITNDKITNKTLYYYYPTGQLMRKIVASDDGSGFYAEEYYNNGKIAEQATFINEGNRIGIEKKYDTTGVLRQEIPWVLPKDEINKPIAERKSIRFGNVVTYYPNGAKAAVFSVGKNGNNTFYNQQGTVIKEIPDNQILSFHQELNEEDCQGATIHLDLQSLVELYEDEGDISYNKCGLPYRENFMYEIKDKTDNKAIMLSYDDIGMIRRITPYNNGLKEGLMQKFDAAGNLTAEINYRQGVKDGVARGYFPTKETAFQKHYVNGKVEGDLICYFPNGEIAAKFHYQNGLKEGKAKVNSPVEKEMLFTNDKMMNIPEKAEKRQLVSALSALKTPESQCLDVNSKISALMDNIENSKNSIYNTFAIKYPNGCEDINSFKKEDDTLSCYNAENKRLATIPASYPNGDYVVEKLYTPEGKHTYDISYANQKKQGWTYAYETPNTVSAEIYYNQDNLSGTSRSYYPNGRVDKILSFAEDAPRKMLADYDEKGNLLFSLTYKDNNKQEAFINRYDKGERIVVRFYEDKPDNIRESNLNQPNAFTEYNLALGEYTVYQNNELVKGGKLCGYQIAENIEVIKLKTEPDTAKPQPEIAPVASVSENKPQEQEIQAAPEKDDLDELLAVITDKTEEAPEYKVENAVIPSPEEKKQAELASKNIGPISKPDIEDISTAVQKTVVSQEVRRVEENVEPKTEKFYYPNGNIRKTVKTKGSRTEEIKEYSKNGLLLTDTVYDRDKISIEKYYGSGEVRRKTQKTYDDNAVTAFISREDLYDNGNQRYEIKRQPSTMLFLEKIYYPDGKLKSETKQNSVFHFITKEYNKEEVLEKETEQLGFKTLVKEYDKDKKLQKVTLDGKEIAQKGSILLKEKAIIYDNKGKLASSFELEKNHNNLLEYYPNGKVKTEIIFYANGEISVKEFNNNGNATKLAYLAYDGRLHIEKPEMRAIPSYRERHWVDYNNPYWIENQDKYSIKSIAHLNLDIASDIVKELKMSEPQILKQLKAKY
ncbi:MAG: hypothetical protein J6W96_03020, partial [Alphaproteobacteria bacterium]|nr:hypothetical protein [Alphaproteobacteria bacterium]